MFAIIIIMLVCGKIWLKAEKTNDFEMYSVKRKTWYTSHSFSIEFMCTCVFFILRQFC